MDTLREFTHEDVKNAPHKMRKIMIMRWQKWVREKREEDISEKKLESSKIYRFKNRDKIKKWNREYYLKIKNG